MKILYRPQCGLLSDAMQKVKEFSSLKEMFTHIVKEHDNAFGIDDINISYYCYDDRIDWETFIITTNRYGDEDYLKVYQCPQGIGFCAFKERSKNET